MARGHARIKTTIWKDENFVARTPEAQRVYFMLLSQPGLSFCGVIDYTGRRWAALAKGTTAKTVAKAIEELAGADFLVVDEDHEEVWVRSFVRHDGVLSGGPKLHSAMWKDFAAIASPMIRRRFLESLPADIREGAPDDPPDTPSEAPSDDPSATDPPEDAMPHPMPRGGARPLPSSPCHPAPAPPDEHSSSSRLNLVGRPAADDDEGSPTEKALALMADRRIAAAIAAGNVIQNPGGYRRRTLEGLNGEFGDKAEAMLKAGATPEAVADKLVPVGSAAANRWPEFVPPPVPDEPPASVEGLAVVRSALGGGA